MTVNKMDTKKPSNIEDSCVKVGDLHKSKANENSKVDAGLYNLWIRSHCFDSLLRS